MSGLREVLAAHQLADPEWSSLDCACGHYAAFEGGGHSVHLEALALEWVEERLTGAREDVAERASDVMGDDGHGVRCEFRERPQDYTADTIADAALDVIRQALTKEQA